MLNILSTVALWLGAIIVSLIPGAVALDTGGVLPWSYWAAAVAVLVPSLLALAAIRADTLPRGWQAHLMTLLLIAMGVYAYFQTVSLPGGLVGLLSPGSHAAWAEWLPEWARGPAAAGGADSQPLSVTPFYSLSYAAIFVVMAGFAWCGSMLFASRGRIAWLLAALAATGAVHALMGFWQVFMHPSATWWGIEAGSPFGVFINRNNAAGLLNVSMAAGLGLLGWRLAAVTGHEFGDREFTFSAVLDLINDRASVIAMAAIAICLAGLLACGSRGGLAGAVAGLAVAVGLLSSTRLTRRLMASVALALVLAFVLLARTDVTPRTLERFGASAEGISNSLLSDARIPHWSDSLNAVREYLPAGAGFGTYRYAYLPYEQIGANNWFIHADNLWLEWLLEAGLVAVAFLACGFGMLLYALLQLGKTPDPMDHGLATAGWYALVATAVGQAFDFGLLLSGTAAATALLFGAVLGRAAISGIPLIASRDGEEVLQFETGFRPYRTIGVGAAVLLLAGLATWRLAGEARVDTMIRTAAAAEVNEPALEEAIASLDQAAEISPLDPDLPYTQAQLHLRMARLAGADVLIEAGVEDPAQAWQAASIRGLRRILHEARRPTEDNENQSAALRGLVGRALAAGEEHFRQAETAAITALGKAPLAAEPRFVLLRLDYAETPSPRSQQLFSQVVQLRSGAGISLSALARLAAESGDWATATEAWQRMLAKEPRRTRAVLQAAAQAGHPEPVEVVPPVPEALHRGAEYTLATSTPNESFMRHVIEQLSAEAPEDRVERAEQYALLGRLHIALAEQEPGFEWYRKAISTNPTSIAHRIGYIRALADAGQLTAAKRAADEAAELTAEKNARLESLTKSIQKRLAAPLQERFLETPQLTE